MKKLISFFLSMMMLAACASSALAASTYETTKLGAQIAESDYQELLRQGWSEESIDYMDDEDVQKYLSEYDRELIQYQEKFFLYEANGNPIEVPKPQAEAVADDINHGIMPCIEGSAVEYDSVCKVALSFYYVNGRYQFVGEASWLAGNQPNQNSQDILGVLHSEGLLSKKAFMSATMWYDYSNSGINYSTKKVAMDSSDFEYDLGAGMVCSFPRQVINPSYNADCKNFRYQVVIESTKNSTAVQEACVQAIFQRGIQRIGATANIGLTIEKGSFSAGFSISPTYVKSFAPKIVAEIAVAIN